MKQKSLTILRIGLAITFIWIGAMIVKNPTAWSKLIQPWALKFMPSTWLASAMFSTGILDIALGVFLLLNIFTGLVALVASIHLITVLITVGVSDDTVRDIGLLGATIALTIQTWPKNFDFRNKR